MALFLRKLKKRPKKVLVARTDRIGDFILTLPVLEVLAKNGISPSVLCRSLVTPLLENNPHIDNVITVDSPGKDVIDEIRSYAFDCLLVLVNDPTTRGLLPHLREIPVRIGPLSKPSVFFAYTHPVIQKRSHSLMNEAEYNLELLEILGLTPEEPPRPQLYFAPEEIQMFREDFSHILVDSGQQSLIVFHQGMAGSALNWSDENYGTLLSGLLEQGYQVVLTGHGDEEADRNLGCMNRFSPLYQGRLFDLSNALTLRQLGLLIHLSDLFIGPSTGPTHLANAVGTNIISFYPPIQVQSTRRWGPYLSSATIFTPDVRCGQKFRCIGEKCPDFFCMDRIPPRDVLTVATELLSDSGRESGSGRNGGDA